MDLNDVSFLVMYAVSPCHVGSGSALGTVDLPIQRERHTNWPFIPASGMKGAFRANFERYKDCKLQKSDREQFTALTDNIFGDTASSGSAYGGAISLSDAKLLAFPMRSNIAPFVWITCPAVLKRLERDIAFGGAGADAAALAKLAEKVTDKKALALRGGVSGAVLLEDCEVDVEAADTSKITPLLACFSQAERLLLVSDDVFNYGVSDCTQISAQITIDEKTGTTRQGSLRYQEDLPADSILYCVVNWGDSRAEDAPKAETIRGFVKQVLSTHIQVGGDETLGHGIFQLTWDKGAADAN